MITPPTRQSSAPGSSEVPSQTSARGDTAIDKACRSSAVRRQRLRPTEPGLRQQIYDVIFEADSPSARWFDIVLLVAILTSIVAVSLETLPGFENSRWLLVLEWILTAIFTAEYVARLVCVRNPLRYARSFWGIVDLLSFLPSYVTLFVGGNSRSFVILRSIRLLRVFRVLKLWRMMDEAEDLSQAVWRAREKIIVFLSVVLVAVTISGTLMYHIEKVMTDESQFTSIPQAMYWAIVTMTTVGYGDVVPKTAPGKVISAALILLGYSLIIVPSTFVSAEVMRANETTGNDRCEHCGVKDVRSDATFCYRCGERLA